MTDMKSKPNLRLLHTFCAQVGPKPPSNFFMGGGVLFRLNFNPKNNHFSDDFPVIFWYNTPKMNKTSHISFREF